MPSRTMKFQRIPGSTERSNESIRKYFHLSELDKKAYEKTEKPIEGDIPRKRQTLVRGDPKDDVHRVLHHTSGFLRERLRHQHFPALNVCEAPLESIADVQNYTSCFVSLPKAVYVAAKHSAHVDLCHRRSMASDSYHQRLMFTRTSYQSAKKRNRNVRKVEKYQVYATCLLDLAERLESEPDPFFHGCYDYYYTGGNLCLLPGEKLPYVIHVDDEHLRRLNIGQLCASDFTFTNNYTAATVDKTTEVFELRALHHPATKHSHVFATRQRNSITLYSLLPEVGRIKPVTMFKSDRTPIISFAQANAQRNIFVVSSLSQCLVQFDLHDNRVVQDHELHSRSGEPDIRWNAIKPWQDVHFVYANERSLCFPDLRSPVAQWQRFGCAEEFACDHISAITASSYDNLLYVATAHQLHCFDARYATAKSAVSRWTHQLEYPPAFMDTFRKDSTELVALSSALPTDLRICELTQSAATSAYKPLSLPYQPPTLQEAYERARRQGKYLLPELDIKQRLRCCTTGLTYHPGIANSNCAALLLTATSNGDVFAATINTAAENRDRVGSPSGEIVCRYAQLIAERIPPATLEHTEVVDMNVMRKIFRCQNLHSSEHWEDKKPLTMLELRHANKRQRLGRWQKSMHALSSYKDALVRDLLAIWDIEDVDMRSIKCRMLNNMPDMKRDPDNFVSSWLNDTTPVPMVSVPLSNTITIENTIACEFSQSLFEPCDGLLHSTQIPQETAASTMNNTTLNTTTQSNMKIKKKAKYVKGF